MENRNIYAELASIPRHIADKITNAKTGGGRSLNAIHDSKNLNSTEKHLMLVVANKMNFTRNFEYQYKDISLNTIANAMSVNRCTVVRIINGYTSRNEKILGLIDKGYIIKHEATAIQQLNGYANHYCLTSKIFDEFMCDMIDDEKNKDENEVTHGATPGGRTVQHLVTHGATPGWCTVQHNIPIVPNSPISPAVEEKKPAAVKKLKKPTWKPTSKMKTWAEKSEIEKMDTVLNKAVDAHRVAVEQRKAKPAPFNDFPDVLRPLIDQHGVEKSKEFFDAIKDSGCDVRKLTYAMKQFACPANPIPAESIIVPEPAESFSEEIIKQMETNTMYIATNPIKIDEVKVESFPIRLKKFYDSLKSRRDKISIKKEIALLGLENFIKMRAPIIMQCTYDELFTEGARKPAFF